MSVIHIVVDHLPSSGHSDAYFALLGALGGAVVVGALSIVGQWLLSKGEDRRVKEQLAHDRDMRDRDALRILLGEAAKALADAASVADRKMLLWQEERQDDDPTSVYVATQQSEVSDRLCGARNRLGMWLAPDDELLRPYLEAGQVLERINAVEARRADGASFDEMGNAWNRERKQLQHLTREFETKARARVGPSASG